MKNLMVLMIVVCIPLTYANSQTGSYNFDFEDWYVDSAGYERLSNWEHMSQTGPIEPGSQLLGTDKSSQSYTGIFGITLHRWYMNSWDAIKIKKPITQKPNYLSGFYKYKDAAVTSHLNPSFNDTAIITTYLTKWNNVTNRADTIGNGHQALTVSSSYIPFSCNIIYFSADQPDSFSVYISPSKYGLGSGVICKDTSHCSYLTLDHLSFSMTTGINNGGIRGEVINIYPNPVKDELFIVAQPSMIIQKAYMTDIMGRIMTMKEGNVQKLNIGNFIRGNYILKLQTNRGIIVRKIIVQP